MTGVLLAGLRECFEDGTDVACELLAVGGQDNHPVRSGSQERGDGDGFELADLAGEDGVPDAELTGCAVEAGLSGEGEEPADPLLGVRAGEGVPDGWRERAGSAEAGQGVGAPVDAVPDRDSGGEFLRW